MSVCANSCTEGVKPSQSLQVMGDLGQPRSGWLVAQVHGTAHKFLYLAEAARPWVMALAGGQVPLAWTLLMVGKHGRRDAAPVELTLASGLKCKWPASRTCVPIMIRHNSTD